MCSTRSPSLGVPAIKSDADPNSTGVLLVGHGSSRRPEALATLQRHAHDLAGRRIFANVRYAALNGGPEPEMQIAQMRELETLLVLPMFMSAGYLVRELLPNRLNSVPVDVDIRFCAPLGLCSAFVDLTKQVARETCAGQRWSPENTTLVLAAHGSPKDDASRNATKVLAETLSASLNFASLRSTFLEEPPFLNDVVSDLIGPTVVVGLFAADGVHAAHDVPTALQQASGPVVYTGALGCDARIADVALSILTGQTTTATVAA